MLIMLYAFLAVRPLEGVIATVLSLGAFALMYLLESNRIIPTYPTLISSQQTNIAVLIIIILTDFESAPVFDTTKILKKS